MARENLNLAQHGGAFRTIPDSKGTVSVATSEGNVELDAFDSNDLSGKWVFFKARGGNVTIQRASSSPTLTAAVGLTIEDGKMEELYVDPAGEMTLYHIGSASCSLDAYFDSEG